MPRIYGTDGDDVGDYSAATDPLWYYSGGNGNDTIVGTMFDDTFIVEAGIDSFPMNQFFGGAGADTFHGGLGMNTFEGGAGADRFYGGAGIDVVAYTASAAGVLVDLAAGYAAGGDATGDSFSRDGAASTIENIVGSRFADTLSGNELNNDLAGGRGDDILAGFAGRNTLSGGAGDDRIVAAGARDVVDGGAGRDTVDYGGETQEVIVDLATGRHGSGAEGDTLIRVENVVGTAYSDILRGDDRANVLDVGGGASGADVLEGRGGADTLIGSAAAGTVDLASYESSATGVAVDLTRGRGFFGDAAGDVLSNIDAVLGSDFADTLTGSAAAEAFWGEGGADVLTGGSADTLNGGAGDDVVRVTGGDVVVSGGADDDTFLRGGDNWIVADDGAAHLGTSTFDGGAGFDRIAYTGATKGVWVDLAVGAGAYGADGDLYAGIEAVLGSRFGDQLVGDDRANDLHGGAGDDILAGGGGGDLLTGGAGVDGTSYFRATSGVSVDLHLGRGTGGEALGDVLLGIEDAYGSLHGDKLTGSNGANALFGMGGNDLLIGDHFATGGRLGGDDVLTGGFGRDTLLGLGGDDMFVFATAADSGRTTATADTITDFTTGDVIDLSAIDANAAVGGDQAFAFVGSGAFTALGQVRVFAAEGDTFVALNVAGDTGADMLIRLANGHQAVAQDFHF